MVGRLLRRSDFLAAARGRKFHTERMSVQGLRRDRPAPGSALRIGFTITKKVGHATERNRVRRRLRAASAEAAPPFSRVLSDVVVIGRRPVLGAPFRLLVDDLARALASVTRTSSGPAGSPRPASLSGSHD